jgi:transcriptional regulator with XRE-family HTH domain
VFNVLGKRLIGLRKKSGLTQEELALRLNISRGTYAHYEIGKRNPDYATLKMLANFFGVTTDYLLDRPDLPPKDPDEPTPQEIIVAMPAMAAPQVILDGRNLTFDVPPTIENDRTLVPLRAIFEALGADVQWDGATQQPPKRPRRPANTFQPAVFCVLT